MAARAGKTNDQINPQGRMNISIDFTLVCIKVDLVHIVVSVVPRRLLVLLLSQD